jgi:hypothetical protein
LTHLADPRGLDAHLSGVGVSLFPMNPRRATGSTQSDAPFDGIGVGLSGSSVITAVRIYIMILGANKRGSHELSYFDSGPRHGRTGECVVEIFLSNETEP